MEENGQLVKFLYNESREVEVEEESNGNIIRYIRGLGIISSDSESARTYYHYVSDEQGSVTHILEGAGKDGSELIQVAESNIINRYTYDAFGNTIECEEQVHNRFRYNGEQYDPVTNQYYLRARFYNPAIARFTQEDTYYGDGLNLYQYCANNPVRYKEPSGHGAVEQNPYQRYQNEGAHPVVIDLAGQLYPDLASKQHLVDKYKAQGYKAADALELANRELLFGAEAAESYAAQNMTKAFPDATQPYDPNSDFRLQQRLYESSSGLELPKNTTDAGKRGSKLWNDAKKKIKESNGKGINTRTVSQEEAERLINEARPELEKKPTYSKEGKSGYEIHPAEPDVGNNKPHIKWWDWSNGKAKGAEGHIFFD